MNMLNIDKLRYNWDKPFLDLMEGMERKVHPDEPHITLWYKNNKWYFEYFGDSIESPNRLFCSNHNFKLFERYYNLNNKQIHDLIIIFMVKYTKIIKSNDISLIGYAPIDSIKQGYEII